MSNRLKSDHTTIETFALPGGDSISVNWEARTVDHVPCPRQEAAKHNDELLQKMRGMPHRGHREDFVDPILKTVLKEFGEKQTEAEANADTDDALAQAPELNALVRARDARIHKEKVNADIKARIRRVVEQRDPSYGRAEQLPLPLSDVREGFKMHPSPKPYLFPDCPREGTSHKFALQAVRRILAKTQQPVCCQAIEAEWYNDASAVPLAGRLNMWTASGALSDLFLRGFLMRKMYHCGCVNCKENTKPLFHYVLA
jgi:hypothetical protein